MHHVLAMSTLHSDDRTSSAAAYALRSEAASFAGVPCAGAAHWQQSSVAVLLYPYCLLEAGL
jgi:hypothetical protein